MFNSKSFTFLNIITCLFFVSANAHAEPKCSNGNNSPLCNSSLIDLDFSTTTETTPIILARGKKNGENKGRGKKDTTTTTTTTAPPTTTTTAPTTTSSSTTTTTTLPKATTTTSTTTTTTIPNPQGPGPASIHGQLSVCGNRLCNQYNDEIQLTGMSSHGIHWYGWGYCMTESSMDLLANEWNNDLFRIAMYYGSGKPDQPAYMDDPQGNIDAVNRIIEEVSDRDMYAIVDFHILSPGGVEMLNTEDAIDFFTAIATANKGRTNLIYEIANEPYRVSWEEIKSYAETVIPEIRAIDPDAVILVGTRGWSSFGMAEGSNYLEVFNNPVDEDNIMYSFHFYAAEHGDRYLDQLREASNNLPVFVSEWGAMDASGQHENDFCKAQDYLDLMEGNKISWAAWNFSSDQGSSSIWNTNYCSDQNKDWAPANLKPHGVFLRDYFTNQMDLCGGY